MLEIFPSTPSHSRLVNGNTNTGGAGAAEKSTHSVAANSHYCGTPPQQNHHIFDADLIIRRAQNALDVEMAGLRQVREGLGHYYNPSYSTTNVKDEEKRRTAAVSSDQTKKKKKTNGKERRKKKTAIKSQSVGREEHEEKNTQEGEGKEVKKQDGPNLLPRLTSKQLARWAKSCDTIVYGGVVEERGGGSEPRDQIIVQQNTEQENARKKVHKVVDEEEDGEALVSETLFRVHHNSSNISNDNNSNNDNNTDSTASKRREDTAAGIGPRLSATVAGAIPLAGLISQSTNPPERSRVTSLAARGASLDQDDHKKRGEGRAAVEYGIANHNFSSSPSTSSDHHGDHSHVRVGSFPDVEDGRDHHHHEEEENVNSRTDSSYCSSSSSSSFSDDDDEFLLLEGEDYDNETNATSVAVAVKKEDYLSLCVSEKGLSFVEAVKLCHHCKGRVVVVGMGKSGHVGRKIAATLASTGTPSFFLHAAEASHGDLGMITPVDVVLAISNSGETPELVSILPVISRVGAKLIALTGNAFSTLGRVAHVVLDCRVDLEACPMNLSPTASSTAQLALGDALAVVLLQEKGFTASDFALRHPGGALGKRLLCTVSEVMRKVPECVPIVQPTDTVFEVMMMMNELGSSAAIVLNEKVLPICSAGAAPTTAETPKSVPPSPALLAHSNKSLGNTSKSFLNHSSSSIRGGGGRGGGEVSVSGATSISARTSPRKAAAAAIASSVRSMVTRSPGALRPTVVTFINNADQNTLAACGVQHCGSVGGGAIERRDQLDPLTPLLLTVPRGQNDINNAKEGCEELDSQKAYQHQHQNNKAVSHSLTSQTTPLMAPRGFAGAEAVACNSSQQQRTSDVNTINVAATPSVSSCSALSPSLALGVFSDADVRFAVRVQQQEQLSGNSSSSNNNNKFKIGALSVGEVMRMARGGGVSNSNRILTIRASALAADAAAELTRANAGKDKDKEEALHSQENSAIIVTNDAETEIIGLVTAADLIKAKIM